jgi:glutaredoxin
MINMNNKKKTFIAILIIILGVFILNQTSKVSADALPANQGKLLQEQNTVSIYFFWGDGCPHCAVAKPYLQSLGDNNSLIEVFSFEVYNVPENLVIFEAMTKAYGFEPRAVPTIFIGDKYWEGFSDIIQNEIQQEVDRCLVEGCEDRGKDILAPTSAIDETEILEATPSTVESESEIVKLPLFGEIDLSSKSLFLSTLLIAFVDGFNPCSIWILSMLLALTLHTGSRKKVLFIGLIFISVTAAIYGLFITGLFTVFKVISFVWWIQLLVALVALFFALVNIKDYFWYKEGVSFTISDKQKPGIFQRMRKLMDASQSYWGLAGGTILMAAGVSLVEFSCTAGFPVLWTNLLVSQNVGGWLFVLLLLVYLIIYQLDELGIFLIAVFSMKASKMEEKHGRILKLIGGVLMLCLAGVMLINPSLMNDIGSTLLIFGIAFLVTLVILFVHRWLLPRLGIKFGSEAQGNKKRNRK